MMNLLWLNRCLSSLPMPSARQVTCALQWCRMNLDLKCSLCSTFNTWTYRYICITPKCIHIQVHECYVCGRFSIQKSFRKLYKNELGSSSAENIPHVSEADTLKRGYFLAHRFGDIFFSVNVAMWDFRGSSFPECLRSVWTSGYDGKEMNFHL